MSAPDWTANTSYVDIVDADIDKLMAGLLDDYRAMGYPMPDEDSDEIDRHWTRRQISVFTGDLKRMARTGTMAVPAEAIRASLPHRSRVGSSE